MQHDGFDRITSDEYLGDLSARPLDEVRLMRAQCQAVEADFSYLRRLVQGRLDIVAGELRHRATGRPPSNGSDLVANLAGTFSERNVGPARGAFVGNLGPSDATRGLTDELDAICSGGRLASLDQLDDAALQDLVGALEQLEREVSRGRSATFGRLDELSAEITRRYRTGEASIEHLLHE